MCVESEGSAIPFYKERALIRTGQVPRRTRTHELCREVGFSLFWRAKSQAVCDQMCFKNWSSGSQEVLVNTAVLKTLDSTVKERDQGQISALPLPGWISLEGLQFVHLQKSHQVEKSVRK